MPTRLATGYLPGQRDLLSGAYAVRGQDAHAWAEILFNDHGWVPFDGAPRPELAADAGNATGSQLPGLDYLFESSVGDDLLKAAVGAPSKLTDGLKDAFTSPATAALAAIGAAGDCGGSSGPHHQDSGEAKIRESTAGVSRKPSSDGKARGCSSKHLCGLTAWNT